MAKAVLVSPKKTSRALKKKSVHVPRHHNLWYKDAVIYELHVRSFADSDGDGIGDFRGLTSKLDYFQDLGVTALWLLPFYPSPLKDEGYDTADYTNIHPMYGTLQEFRQFLKEAHRRRLKVITELVLNHTSDQHPWFQRARLAPKGSSQRNFYTWTDNPEKYRDARVIFKDYEQSNWSWDPVAGSYYWHRFYSHQPDLNYDSLDVQKAMLKVVDFWFDMGVDGMRLDAVPYLFEREDTSCENLPETHVFLKRLRSRIDRKYHDRMLLAEANQWPEDAVTYFGKGDECHMAFHFPIMPRLFMALRMEDHYPIVDILNQTPAIPQECQWALFLRNHDELTLEMVTDEERDYMYRVYANDPQARLNLGIRRRLSPLLSGNRRKIELMTGLLFSLPGTPILYYGDEIGMGDNIYLGDRNGVRTPMQWNGDRNAGFGQSNPQKLFLPVVIDPEYHYEAVNVEAQQNNSSSILWWTKRMIGLRKNCRAFGRGSVRFLEHQNSKVLVFLREEGSEKILVVANLSRFVQYVELDLKEFQGKVPLELIGKNRFPAIGELPYFLTLGPHSFYWFLLEEAATPEVVSIPGKDLPKLEVQGRWQNLLDPNNRKALESILPSYLMRCRWFSGKDKRIMAVKAQEATRIEYGDKEAALLFLQTEYLDSESETYVLPVCLVDEEVSKKLNEEFPTALLARVEVNQTKAKTKGFLSDAVYDDEFSTALLDLIVKRRSIRGIAGEFKGHALGRLRDWRRESTAPWQVERLKAQQSNTSIAFGQKVIFKLYRRLEAGINPDPEISLFLSEKTSFRNTPLTGGYLEYLQGRSKAYTLGILQEWIPNEGDAWKYALDQIDLYYDRALTHQTLPIEEAELNQGLLTLSEREVPEVIRHVIGEFLEAARLLGQRTAELHLALAGDSHDKAFKAEPFSPHYQRGLYQSLRNGIEALSSNLSKKSRLLSGPTRETLQRIQDERDSILRHLKPLMNEQIRAHRIRIHGDYHLGQVLYTGKDFCILDFEGEPLRSLEDRKSKRSALKDVAGMIRSFHYAAYTGLWDEETRGQLRLEDAKALEQWAKVWYRYTSAVFLKAYREKAQNSGFLPSKREHLKLILDAFLIEKAVYEVGYELSNRPDWVRIPIQGILECLESAERKAV